MVTIDEMIVVLRRLVIGTIWTGAEIDRRRTVLRAIIALLQSSPAPDA